MTLDELVKQIGGVSDEKVLQDLARYIEEWKGDDRNVEALETMVERFLSTSCRFDEDMQVFLHTILPDKFIEPARA